MKTDRLIELLAHGVEPAGRTPWRRNLALTVIVGFAVALTLVAIGLGFRTDIGAARMPIMMKAAFSAFAAAIVLPMAIQLMKPGRPLGWRVGAVLLFVALCAFVTVVSLLGEAPQDRLRMWLGGVFPWCLVFVPLLSAPTAVGLLGVMRSFAPTRLAMAGAAIGAFSGGVAAIAYSMYCPVDSVAFVTTWYVLAIGVCAALGATIGARLLRW